MNPVIIVSRLGAAFDWMTAHASLFTAAAAVTGATIAVLGYRKWLPESVGKRKIELAEEVLADFYRAKDVIAWARFPGGYGHEGATRERAEGEDADVARVKDAYFIPIERLNAEVELFTRIQSKKYRAMAYFGTEAGQPFEDLKAIHGRIFTAVRMLIRTWRDDGARPRRWDEWEAIIGGGIEPDNQDEIAKEIEELVERIDQFYGQWLMRRTKSRS